MAKKHIMCLLVRQSNKRGSHGGNRATSIGNILSERRWCWLSHLLRMYHQHIPQLELCWEVTRRAKHKLARHSQEISMKNGTHLGRDRSSSSRQTSIAPQCGPMRAEPRSRSRHCNNTTWVLCRMPYRVVIKQSCVYTDGGSRSMRQLTESLLSASEYGEWQAISDNSDDGYRHGDPYCADASSGWYCWSDWW